MRILTFIFFISVYLVLPENAFAQYKSIFGENSTSWSEINPNRCDYIETAVFRNQGTAFIKGKNYIQIYGQISDYILVYFLREDTLAGKIYFMHWTDSVEHLIIDFSLNAGDTFVTDAGSKFIADSVYYVDGLKHIQFNALHKMCGESTEKLTFIEGTGSTAGIFMNNWRNVDETIKVYLLCHYKDDLKVYSNKFYSENCIVEVGVPQPKADLSAATVVPNPTSGEATFDFYRYHNFISFRRVESNVTARIFDLYGRLIFEGNSANGFLPFSLAGFADGIYPYILQDDLGNTVRGKIVKDE